jgi:hypothetical protein
MAIKLRPERTRTLRQAAATVFSLLALLPLLIFVWTLHRVNALYEPEAQLGLGLSLAVAVLGFIVLRRLMGQISEAMQALASTAARAAQMSTASAPKAQPTVAAREAGATERPVTPPRSDAAPAAPTPPSTPSRGPERAARDGGRRSATGTLALGTIRELADMTDAVSALWRREAEAKLGRSVRVDVINSTAPLVGTLVQVTEDGLLLEQQDGNSVAVVWRRIAAVEADGGAHRA